MGMDEWYRRAWEAYKRNFPQIVIGTTAIALIIFLFVLSGLVAVSVSSVGLFGMGAMLVIFPIIVVAGLLLVGYVLAFDILLLLGALRGEADVLSSLKGAFKYCVGMLCLVFLLSLIGWGILLLFFLVLGLVFHSGILDVSFLLGAAVLVIVLLFLFLLAVWISVRTIWAPVYLVSDGLGPVDALRKSWAVSGAHTWKAVEGFLAMILVICVGALLGMIPIVGPFLSIYLVEPIRNLVVMAVAEDLAAG